MPEDIAQAEVGSPSNFDLLDQTEQLLAKMSRMSSSADSAGADENQNNFQNINGNEVTKSAAMMDDHSEHSNELDNMLERAGQLSAMMQSISNISVTGASQSKRDPDGNNSHGVDPPTMESVRKDPPGSVVGDIDEHANKVASSSLDLHQKPASSVHVHTSMMDDDVSSVGSASFRPAINSNFTNRNNLNSTFNIHKQPELPEESADDLLGVPPNQQQSPNIDNKFITPDQAKLKISTTDVAAQEAENLEPVCLKIPPTDLRADFDVVESSPRKSGDESGVQWEKVMTASPGEDDYVPMADYSHIRPSKPNALGAGMSLRDKARRRNMAQRKRRKRMVLVACVGAVSAFAYFYFFRNPIAEEVVEVPEPELLFQSFDTSVLLRHSTLTEGFCFEDFSRDPSLVITLRSYSPPPVVEEEAPKRSIFGRMRMK